MSTLEDLGHESITEMQIDESLELIRQIRLSRRVPMKKVKTVRKKSPTPTPTLNSDQAAKLLSILTGE